MLHSFFSVLRFEAAKAVRAKVTWFTLLLPALVALVAVWVDSVARHVQALASEESGIEVASTAWASFARGASSGFVLGGILLLLYSSMIVANEGHWRTFKTIMLRPHPRPIWILSKFTLLLMMVLAIVVLVTGAALAAGAWTSEFGDIAEEGYVIYEASYLREESRRAVLLVITPLVALAAFGLMFSTLSDHPGIAISGALGAFIVLETMKDSMPERRVYFFNTFTPSLLDTSYFQALRGFADGMSDTGWQEGMAAWNVGTPLVWAAVALTVALAVFQRRNFLL